MLYLGADHRGYYLKEKIKEFLVNARIPFKDLGAQEYNPNDSFVSFGKKVAQKVSQNPEENRGVAFCGTGIGMSIICNKFPDIRAALCLTAIMARQSRKHLDSNILCLPADIIEPSAAWRIIKAWLKEPKADEARYLKRLEQIKNIEKENFKS